MTNLTIQLKPSPPTLNRNKFWLRKRRRNLSSVTFSYKLMCVYELRRWLQTIDLIPTQSLKISKWSKWSWCDTRFVCTGSYQNVECFTVTYTKHINTLHQWDGFLYVTGSTNGEVNISHENTTMLLCLNKDRPTWCHLLYYFTIYCSTCSDVSTSIFMSLRLIVDLFRVLYCSGSMCVGVTVWFGWGGVVSLCRLQPT